ncbi:hypothetical protein ACJX0J_025345, partial [Zea mays]
MHTNSILSPLNGSQLHNKPSMLKNLGNNLLLFVSPQHIKVVQVAVQISCTRSEILLQSYLFSPPLEQRRDAIVGLDANNTIYETTIYLFIHEQVLLVLPSYLVILGLLWEEEVIIDHFRNKIWHAKYSCNMMPEINASPLLVLRTPPPWRAGIIIAATEQNKVQVCTCITCLFILNIFSIILKAPCTNFAQADQVERGDD